MDVESMLVTLVVLIPLLLVGEGLAGVVLWRMSGSRIPVISTPAWGNGLRGRVASDAVIVGTWLVLTVLTLWCAFLVSFMVVHALLFTLGTSVAIVGLVGSAGVLATIPFAWGRMIRHHLRRG